MESTFLEPQIIEQINQLLTLGLSAHEDGQFEEAEKCYLKILEKNPNHGDAHHLLGVLCHEKKAFEKALTHLETAIQLSGVIAPFYNSLGNLLTDMQEVQKAQEAYQKAIEICIHSPLEEDKASLWEYYLNLGTAYHYLKLYPEAQKTFLQALELAPSSPELFNNLGNLYRDQSDFEAAILNYENAIALDPGYFVALYNLGGVYQKSQDIPNALKIWHQIIAITPQFAQAYDYIGTLYFQQGQTQDAIDYYLKAQAVNPNYARAYLNLGTLYQSLSKMDEALKAYEKALAIEPQNIKCLLSLGSLYHIINQPEQAIQQYEKAYEISGEDSILCKIALTLPIFYDTQESLHAWRDHHIEKTKALWEKAKAGNLSLPNPLIDVGLTNFYLTYQGLNDKDIQIQWGEIYSWCLEKEEKKREESSSKPFPLRTRNTKEKIRLGIVSRFMRKNHTIGKILKGLVDHFPRQDFEITLLGLEDALLQKNHLMPHPHEQYIGLPMDQLEKAKEQILKSQQDILFYTDIGMEPTSYHLAMKRMAPVQCTFWGHPVTTGIPTMDYFLSNPGLELSPTESEALQEWPQDHYSEKLILLNYLPCYFELPPHPQKITTKEQFLLNPHKHHYVCPQSHYKFHPDFDSLLKGILEADPLAEIVMIHGNYHHYVNGLRRRWAQIMDEKTMNRILFLNSLNYEDFLDLQVLADVLIDPIHYGGGNTSYEGLAFGTPIVTWPQKFLKNRIAHALYQQMGVTDCIVNSQESYIQKAVEIASNPEYRQSLKEKILKKRPQIYEDIRGISDMAEFFKTLFE
ncbi:MAG: tetratricopeptide repeat protein [Cyanobacteria bacterium]|nr:tetratricopeptide repeat protein [Cyanobacteriota bacterium]